MFPFAEAAWEAELAQDRAGRQAQTL
jgi:hypothetical protein